MGIDRSERGFQRKAPSAKTKHPYAAIEHRVLDSPAYADLGFGARAVLTIITRQLSKDNNGHLQASFTFCKRYGIGSEHTLRKAIMELLAHGMIYRTRSHGANGTWAKYAVTWLPIKQRDGLFLGGYAPEAWKLWEPLNKKSSRQKVQDTPSRKRSFRGEFPAGSAGSTPAESAVYELMPCSNAERHIETEGSEA